MKLKYIFASIVAALALVSCEKEADHYLKEIKVSSSYVALNTAGGSTAIEIEATDSWSISEMPEWLSISPASGSAGKSTVNFSAGEGEGRTAEIVIKCGGKTQRINVIQGIATVSNATCAEVIAGPDSKTYRVTGTVTSIVNTTYGNWYLQDETDEIYIYGTLDAKGNTKNFLSLGLEVGDEVTVEGPKTTYNGTVELVDVTVLKINKSLIKVESTDPEDAVLPQEGGDLTVTLANKGNNIGLTIPEDAKSWLGVSSISDNVVVLTAAANEGGDRETTVVFNTTDGKKDYTAELKVTQKGAIKDITAVEFNQLADGTALYRVKGVITEIVMDKNDPTKYNKYGNFHIQDGTGSVYVYGLLPEAGGATGQDVLTSKGIKVGDVITVVGPKGSYKDSPQMVNGVYEEHTSVKSATAAEFNALADGSDLYLISGKITEIVMDKNDPTKYNKYGNFYIEDETGKVYVYGLVPVSGQSGTDMLTKLNIKVGDEITVAGPKGSYKGSPQMVNGYYVTHKESSEEGGEEGGDEGGDTPDPFATNVNYTLGSSSYDDGVMNVTLGENTYNEVFTLKFGTSKKYGDATITLPAGTKKVTYYAIAWKGNPASLKFSVGDNVMATQDIAANDGASGNSPYTATVSDSDKYEIVFESALAADTAVKVETFEGTNTGFRALLFGIQAAK